MLVNAKRHIVQSCLQLTGPNAGLNKLFGTGYCQAELFDNAKEPARNTQRQPS